MDYGGNGGLQLLSLADEKGVFGYSTGVDYNQFIIALGYFVGLFDVVKRRRLTAQRVVGQREYYV